MLETLCSSGDRVFDGENYSGGVLSSVKYNERSATITMSANADRVAEVNSGTWRNRAICQIYSIAADPGVSEVYTEAQAFLVLDGVIDTSSHYKGMITVKAVHQGLSGKFTPAHNCSQFSNRIPSSGTVIGGSSDKYPLEGRT